MALATEQAILDLQITNAALLEAVNVTKANIQSLIDAAVLASENATLIPLADATTNSMVLQTLFINHLNTYT
jgi:hypothetical protein